MVAFRVTAGGDLFRRLGRRRFNGRTRGQVWAVAYDDASCEMEWKLIRYTTTLSTLTYLQCCCLDHDSPSESRRSPGGVAGFGCPNDCLRLAAIAWTNVVPCFCDNHYSIIARCFCVPFRFAVHHNSVVHSTYILRHLTKERPPRPLRLRLVSVVHRSQPKTNVQGKSPSPMFISSV